MRIGTRGSPLALAQARLVAERLHARAGTRCELVPIETTGDRGDLAPSGSIKGLFVKEIEAALIDGSIDLAVHSAKDLASTLPPGLALVGALPREDPADALILPNRDGSATWDEVCRALGAAPRLGTGSLRRAWQLRAVLPEARFVDARGNVDTRLRKLDAGHFDGLVLATAGLVRLGLAHRITCRIPREVCVPAPGQGIIALQTRADADDVHRHVATIGDADAWTCLCAERAVVARLEAGCRLPIAALATLAGGVLTVEAAIAAARTPALRAVVHGQSADATALGTRVAEALLAAGGSDILRELRPSP